MDFGNIVGQLMQQGLSPVTEQRLQHSVGESGLGGLGDILGNALGGSANQGGGGLGGILGSVSGALSGDSGVGGLSQGQVGGIGAIAGALLGGGGGAVKGAVGGGAMALLGTLAISALKNWQAQQAGGNSNAAGLMEIGENERRQMSEPQTAELCLRAMIEAVKSDGEISSGEVERILGKLQEGGITSEEQQFVRDQMQRPSDLDSLIARIPNPEVGVQVYTAALMAISVDTEAERSFLGKLAHSAGLDRETLQRLHLMVGAPSPAS